MKLKDKILNFFIPVHIKNQDELYRKACLLVSVHLLMLLVTTISRLFKFVSETGTQLNYTFLAITLLGSLLLFRKYGEFIISGNVLAVVIAMALGPLSLTTGGIYSMDFIFMIVIPLLAYLFANKFSGYLWFGLLCIYSIILFLAELNSPVSFREQIKDLGPDYYFIISITLTLMIAGIVWIFEEGQIANIKALKKSREILEKQTTTLEKQTNTLEKQTRTLKKQEKSLIASNQELEHYAKVVSHDLKEPLRNVNTYAQLMIRELTKNQWVNPEIEDYLQCINQNIVNMDIMIKDLLEYSRLDAEEKAKYSPMDFLDILYIVSQNLNKQMSENGVEIFTEPLPEKLDVVPVKVIQLFQNLISNAIKFRKKEEICQIRISAKRKEECWLFSIQDNGIGIQKEQQDKVFGLFHKLHHKSKYEGSGIGLATCKKIVELHKGNIWVESEPDVGSTFFFTLTACDN